MSSCLHILAVLLQTALLLPFVWAECYFPDGTADADGYQCNSTAGVVTHCCRTFEACMEGGICYTQWDSQFYRRSCTDENWGEGCPTVCTDVDRDGPNGMLACSQGTNPTYCCSNGTGTCCSSLTEFEFIPGDFLGGLDGEGKLNPPSPPSTITRTSTVNGGSVTTSSGSLSTVSKTGSSEASAGAATSETSSPSSSSAPQDSSTSRTIGLAVGVPRGVLLIGSIVGLFWVFNRKLNREKDERKKLEEKLMNRNDTSRQELEIESGREKGDIRGRDGRPLAEIESSGVRYEMAEDNSMSHEVGTNASRFR